MFLQRFLQNFCPWRHSISNFGRAVETWMLISCRPTYATPQTAVYVDYEMQFYAKIMHIKEKMTFPTFKWVLWLQWHIHVDEKYSAWPHFLNVPNRNSSMFYQNLESHQYFVNFISQVLLGPKISISILLSDWLLCITRGDCNFFR